MKPILTPVILCGPGSNLYPLCDASSSGSSSAKALLAFANRPMLAFALQSVLSAGLSHCIVLAPASQHFAIVRALSNIRLIPPPPAQALSSTERRRAAKETKEERAAWGQINFIEGAEGPSASSQPGMRVELLALGPHDGQGGASSRRAGGDGADLKERFRRAPLGTAELVRWLAALGRLDAADPLILPVDLLAPAFPLRSLIDTYVQAQAANAEPPTVCCAFYERGAGEGVGREREREGPARLISAFSKAGSSGDGGGDGLSDVNQLLFLRDTDLSADLDIRRSLLEHASRARISTRLLDAHTYILNRRQIIPLLEANTKLTSLRDHVLPLVAKASWMKGVREKAGWPAATHGRTSADVDIDDPMHDISDDAEDKRGAGDAGSADAIQCLAVVVRLGGGSDDEQNGASNFVARANTVATYLECNRWLLKALSNTGGGTSELALNVPEIDMTDALPAPVASTSPQASISATTGTSNGAVNESAVAASAQISGDSIVGHGVKIGERASVKRSIVGHHCDIGRGARLAGCILMDGAKVGENCRLDNVICGANSSIGERSGLKDCDVAADVDVPAETNVKNEKLVGDQGDEDDNDDGDEDGEGEAVA